jgi:FKBP-type peptidyl-prolyl cis-trans isomerase FklB
MRHVFMTILSIAIFFGVCVGGENPGTKDEKFKASYSVGYKVGGDLKSKGIDVNSEVLLKGVQDAMEANEPLLTRQEMRNILSDLQKKISKAQEQKTKAEAERNLAEGNTFLAENRTQQGVKVLPNGLQYKVIKEGFGKTPKADDAVTVYYKGTLINGTEFDSSYNSKPATFRADHVIAGWKEALQLMKEGSKWQLFVPPQLGYGERRVGSIGPNSTLIFEIELISIN